MQSDKSQAKEALHYLTLVVLPTQILAYQKFDGQYWQPLLMKGEERFIHQKNTKIWEVILEDINDNFNLKNKLADVKISILYQQDTDFLLVDAVKYLQSFDCHTWQFLSLENLCSYAIALQGKVTPNLSFNKDTQDFDSDWFQTTVLPLVWHEDSLAQQQLALNQLFEDKKQLEQQITLMQNNAEQALAQQVQHLEKDKASLQTQISQAKDQLQRLQQPNIESLVSFLPAIFKEFWNNVRPDELAMLVGNINPPQIPSPYQSPSISAVQQKKRQFTAMSHQNQEKIVQLCRELARNYNTLVMHAEFKSIIGDLD